MNKENYTIGIYSTDGQKVIVFSGLLSGMAAAYENTPSWDNALLLSKKLKEPIVPLHEYDGDIPGVSWANFITVPDVTLPNGLLVPSFRVGKYVCSRDENDLVQVTEDGLPWTNIRYFDAIEACKASGYNSLTETQWIAIAWDASQVDENWTGGKVGKGSMFQGLHKNTVNCAQPGSYVSPDPDERRWLRLSNGEIIYDIGGNVWQWVFDDVQGDERGVIAKPFAKDSVSLMAPYPSMKKGMGWRPDAGDDWSGSAPIRGGNWDSGVNAGPFYLNNVGPTYTYSYIGFRCTK